MSDRPDDPDPELAGKPIGYASPPCEYRWPKGYCPNPSGRPRKKTMKTNAPLSEFQRRILEEANREVARVNGKPFTNLDRLLLQLRSSQRPEDRKFLLTLIQDALQAEHAWYEEAVQTLIAYKEHWGPIFRQRRALGRKVPEVYPDPDDIQILSPTEFRFLGPVTAEEAANWELFKRCRATFVFIANEIIETAGIYAPLEEDRQRYLKLRRYYYRVNRHLSEAFKKKHPIKFPAFKPPAEPPAWYHEEEGYISDFAEAPQLRNRASHRASKPGSSIPSPTA